MSCEIVIEQNIFRAFSISATKQLMPFVVFLELTSACNAHCPFCLRPPSDRFHSKEYLSYQEIKEVLGQARDLGTYFLELTGGGNHCFTQTLAILFLTLANWVLP